MKQSSYNFPTLLTLLRLVVSPIMLPVLLVYLLPFNIAWINGALAALFLFFGITDFFDGYLARRSNQVTAVGALLDPLADKFLVFSTLIALLTIQKIFFGWVIILIGREFFVMGLRQFSLEHGIAMPVSFTAKLKTFFQMAFITVLIVNPYQAEGFHEEGAVWNSVETLLLCVTIWLSLFSAHRYYKQCMQHVAQPHDAHTKNDSNDSA